MTTVERSDLITSLYGSRSAVGVTRQHAQTFGKLAIATRCAEAQQALNEAIEALEKEEGASQSHHDKAFSPDLKLKTV